MTECSPERQFKLSIFAIVLVLIDVLVLLGYLINLYFAASSSPKTRPCDLVNKTLKNSFEARLLPELSKLLFCDTASDVTINCEGERIPAHRVVLITQSTFFKGALSIDMKEKLEGAIGLPESSLVVRSIMTFLYTNDYNAPGSQSTQQTTLHHLKVYVAADKYGIPALKERAAEILINHHSTNQTGYFSKTVPSSRSFDDLVDFIELVTFMYENTHDKLDPLRCKLVNVARAMRVGPHTAAVEDAWIECFARVPAFAYELCMSFPSATSEPGPKADQPVCWPCVKEAGFRTATQAYSGPGPNVCPRCRQPGHRDTNGWYLYRYQV